MGEISKRLKEFQAVYDDMKYYAPILTDFDELMVGRFPCHKNAVGYIDLHGDFYAAFQGVPTINLPGAIMDRLKEFEKKIKESIAGVEAYQKQQAKTRHKIEEARKKCWRDNLEDGSPYIISVKG